MKKTRKVVKHPRAPLTPPLLLHQLLEEENLQALFVVKLKPDGEYSVDYTDNVDYQDLAIIVQMAQAVLNRMWSPQDESEDEDTGGA